MIREASKQCDGDSHVYVLGDLRCQLCGERWPEPRKLEEVPVKGKVVIAHPDSETYAYVLATDCRCDYMLTRLADPGQVYVLDVDRVLVPFSASEEWLKG